MDDPDDAIRRATIDDAEHVAEIFLDATKAAMPYLPEIHTADEVRTWIRDVVLVDQEVHVATQGGSPVAFLSLTETEIEHLYVRPQYWRRGFGSRLLEYAKQRRPDGFHLWVFQKNERARAFYEARGLVLVRTTGGEGNEEGEPDAQYEWPGTAPAVV